MNRLGFIFDLNKCVGCHACVLACRIQNNDSQEILWRQISGYNQMKIPGIPVFHYSIACNHCESAPCLENCPALAYSKDEATAAIIHHEEKCIGCKYCTWTCPYDAPQYNRTKAVVEKCTFCINLLEVGNDPACVNLCPTAALGFERIKVNSEEFPKEFIDQKIGPGIKIIPLRNKDGPEEIASSGSDEIDYYEKDLSDLPQKISPMKDWSLLGFTFLLPVLFGLFTATFSGWFEVPLWIYLGIVALSVIFSVLHLGKIGRAWRSILNLSSSWLSREILSFILFLIFSIVYLATDQNIVVGSLGIVFGTFALVSADMIYKIVDYKNTVWLSSLLTLSAVYLTAYFSMLFWLFAAIALLKIIILIVLQFSDSGNNSKGIIMFLLRLIGGLVLPVYLWYTDPQYFYLVVGFLVLSGEFIGRLNFYEKLSITYPGLKLREDLLNKLTSL